jgi:hypothetical protein
MPETVQPSQAEVYVGPGTPYTIRASQANGYIGPFGVESSDATIATATSPGGDGGDKRSFDVFGHRPGTAIFTLRGYEGAVGVLKVYVTTLLASVHFDAIPGSQSYTINVGGEWGSGPVVSTTPYPSSPTTIELQCSAVSQAIDTSGSVRPLLTTFVQVVVFNGIINVVDKRVAVAVRLGEPNTVDVSIP